MHSYLLIVEIAIMSPSLFWMVYCDTAAEEGANCSDTGINSEMSVFLFISRHFVASQYMRNSMATESASCSHAGKISQ